MQNLSVGVPVVATEVANPFVDTFFGSPTAIGLTAILIVLIVGFVVFLLTASRNEQLIRKELNRLDSDRDTMAEFDSIETLSLNKRVFSPYVIRLSNLMRRITPKERIEKIHRQLIVAGYSRPQTTDLEKKQRDVSPTDFLALQGLFGIVFPVVLFILMVFTGNIGMAFLLTPLSAMIGFYFPQIWLKGQVKKRQEKIQKILPFTLDLLNICSDAGLGLPSSISKVAENVEGPIADEFAEVLRSISLGVDIKDALKDMTRRTDVQELNEFVIAVIQADKLGTGMSRVLKAQSKSMRLAAKQRAQEKAFKAPVKMLFPMVLFIFPSIFIVLLGPAGIKILEALSANV